MRKGGSRHGQGVGRRTSTGQIQMSTRARCGRDFPTSQGDEAVLMQEIADDIIKTTALGEPRTITLITIDDLATLVRLRPLKQLTLRKLQELFIDCRRLNKLERGLMRSRIPRSRTSV